MNDAQREARERIQKVLDETVDTLGPSSEDDQSDVPQGSWMVTGWAMAIDYTVIGDDGETETWTACIHAKGTSSSHAMGLGAYIADTLKPNI